MTQPASIAFGATFAASALAVIAALVLVLEQKGSWLKRILGVLARCAIVLAGAVVAILLFGLVAFLLELSVFPLVSTEAALRVLEAIAFLGALFLAPFAVMLLAGSRQRSALPVRPIAETRSVRGAYVPIVASTFVLAFVGWNLDMLAALVPSAWASVALFLAVSFVFGFLWLAAVDLACVRTRRAAGSDEWWKARLAAFCNRRLKRAANATVACLVAFALCYTTVGDAIPALAEELQQPSAPTPANPDVYEPSADTNQQDQPASSSAAETQPESVPQPGEEDAESDPADDQGAANNEPDVPALPPVDYYEQPDIEGDPVAMDGDATVLKTSERTYTTVIGGASVAYETASGDVRPIDNTMEAEGAGEPHEQVYRNRENSFVAELPVEDEGGQAGLAITVGGRTVRIVPQGVDFSRSSARDEAVRYTEAREGIDWQYTLVGSLVKEDIVINQPVAEQPFDSLLDLPAGLSARIDNGVCRIFDDASGETVMDVTAPLMTDALGEVCDDVELALDRTGGGLVLRLLPNWDWLTSAERAYPVRIDPTENIAPQAVRVGCVEQKSPNSHIGENGYSYAGYDDGVKTGTGAFKPGGHGICRTYAEINYDFGYIMSEARIDSATFSLSQFRSYSGGASNFGLYRITEPWSFDGLSWRGQESLGHELVCFRQARTSQGYIDWDVRECVNNWVQGVWAQRGFCVKAEYERGMQCEMFEHRGSANPPRLVVNWSVPDPVDEGRSLDATTVVLRTLTEHDADNKLQFDGVFADGLATPRATVVYTMDPNGDTGVAYASRSYKYPDSTSWQDSIPNATRYKDKLSNWQSHVFANLAHDTLYKVRALASKDGAVGREAVSDSFLIYQATAKDTLPYIAGHYGTTLDQLAQDNRVQDCLVVGGNTIFVRNPKTNVPYNPQNLTEDQKRRIDSGLMGRGKHCEYGFEPVNMNTGNFVLEGIDAVATEIDGDFELKRTYNSKAANESGAMGRGWSFGYTDHLSAEASGAIVLTESDGTSYWFDPDGEGGYTIDADVGYELERIGYRVDEDDEDSPELFRYEVRDRQGGVRAFDCFGMLESVTDQHGHVTEIGYDERHLMTGITTPSGREFAFEHDAYGRISQTTLPDGSKVSYAYDDAGDLVQVTNAAGGTIRYIYDPQGHMTEWVDPSGASVVRNVYDAEGRVVEQYDANGARSTLEYSEGKSVATDARGSVTVYTYDDRYRTTGITYPDGHSVARSYDADGNLASDEHGTYSYDARGNMTSKTDARGMTWTYAYDEAGNMVSESRPDGETVANAYDARGCLLSSTSSTSGTTAYSYDELCRKVSETDADGYTTTYAYAGADLVAETDAAGNTTTYASDGMGRRISATDPAGNVERTTYNAIGFVTSETDGAGGTTRYVLDARGLLSSLIDPNGAVTSYAYDAAGNMTSMTIPSGGTWLYAYDAEGNCTAETDPLGSTTTRAYDACGRLSSESDPTGVRESWEYDGIGRVVSHTLPSGSAETFSYEGELEEPASETDALGNTTTRTFDALGNVASATYPDGTSERWEHRGDKTVRHVSASGLDTRVALSAAGRTLSVSQSGRTWSYAYDAAGRLVSSTDPLGQTSSVAYDAAGNIASVQDAEGVLASFAYDGAGRETQVTDAAGNATSIAYDAAGNALRETDALGRTTSHAYDADGRETSVTDAAGGVASYAYDAAGNLVAETDAGGATTAYTYDGAARVTSQTDAIGRKTYLAYDGAGNLVSVTLPDGSEQRFGYDAKGQMTSCVDAAGTETELALDWRGNVTAVDMAGVGREEFAYDAEGRAASYVDAAGRKASAVYDVWGSLAMETTVEGLAILYTTDALGRTTSESRSSGATVRYAYDARGNVASSTGATGGVTRYAYDAAGNLVAETDPAGNTTSYEYDPVGNIVGVTDADGYGSSYAYDALDRLTESIDGRGSKTAYAYDAAGNVTSVTDALGNVDTYAYDAVGQLASHTDARGGMEEYAYDALGQLVRHVDAQGGVMAYEYDLAGNLSKETDQLGATTEYVNDAAGNVIKVRRANGAEYAYQYDAVGRIVRMSLPLGYVRSLKYGTAQNPVAESDNLGLSVSYELDAEGRVSRAEGMGASESWSYDADGNLVGHIDRTGASESYAYDAAGRLSAFADGSGVSERYSYDGRGNLTQASRGATVVHYAYDGASNTVSEALGSLPGTSYEYDAANRLVSQKAPTGAVVAYGYDELGNVTDVTDARGSKWTYSYDALGNVAEAISPTGAKTTYSYDTASRLLQVQDADGAKTSYERDAVGNVTQATDALGRVTAYGLDLEGNLTSIASGDGSVERLTYDVAGRLTSVAKQSGSTARYDYDALGNLMDKAYGESSEDATYTYDAEGRVATRDDKCGTATYSYDGAGRLVEEVDGFGQRLAYAYDDAGNLSRMEYPDGQVVEYAYDDAGRMASVSASDGTYLYSYDAAGNCTGIERPSGVSTQAQHDPDGNVTWLKNSSPSGAVLSEYAYDYDAEGRIIGEKSSVKGDDGSMHDAQFAFAYTPAGKLKGVSGVRDGARFSEEYAYDAKGNRISLDRTGDGAEHVAYEYDAADRLVRETSSTRGAVDYAYDADGQLVRKSGAGQAMSYEYGVEGRLQAVREGDLLLMSAVYDGDGKRVAESTLYHASRELPRGGAIEAASGLMADLVDAKEQDALRVGDALSAAVYEMAAMAGALSMAANPAVACEAVPTSLDVARALFGVGGSYVPEGLPSLVLGLGEGGAARGLGAAPSLSVTDERYDVASLVSSTVFEVPQVASSASTRSGESDFLYGLSRLAEATASAAVSFLEDGRGSSVQEATAGGAISAWRAFSAFGGVAAGTSSEGSFFGYNGESQDAATGLVYMHARYYASASGRFCTADANLGSASDPLTLNRYLYCSSDPVNFVDPDGRASMTVRLSKGTPFAYDLAAQRGRAQMSEYQRDFVQKEYGARLSKDPLIVRVRTAVNEVLFTAKRSAYLSQKYGAATAAVWRASVAQHYQKQLADYYCGTASYLANGSYDRDKALQYAYEYSHISLKDGDLEYFYSLVDLLFRNPLYPTYGGNCANFVSQVLHEGGFPMNTDWHSRPSMAGIIAFVTMGISAQEALRFLSGKTFDATRKWTLAAEQFEYFSNPDNGFTSRPIIDVHKTGVLSGKGEVNVSLSDIRSQAVSLGIQKGDLMYFYDEKGVHHATVISEVTSDGIKYSANTVNRYNQDLEDGLENDYGVLIIRVNDETQK